LTLLTVLFVYVVWHRECSVVGQLVRYRSFMLCKNKRLLFNANTYILKKNLTLTCRL